MTLTERDLNRKAGRLGQFLQDPAKHWAVRDPHDVIQGARVCVGDAVVDYFGEDLIRVAALTSSAVTAGGKVCRWCHAYDRARQTGVIPPANEAALKLLGDPCPRCAQITLARALGDFDAIVAEDKPPEPVAAAAVPSGPSVRDLINLARQRQREREAANMAALAAAAAKGDAKAEAKLALAASGEVRGGAG